MQKSPSAFAILTLGLGLGLWAGCGAPGPRIPGLSGDVRVRPAGDGLGVRRAALTQGDGPNGAHIIFLNFDGAMLKAPPNGYGDDASQNESWIANGPVTIPAFDAKPYAPALTRDATINVITNAFKTLYAPFNVAVVTQRPPATQSYTMCMIGGRPGLVGEQNGVAGIAPLDCDNQDESDISFAFSDDLAPANVGSAAESMRAIAVTAAQETAHSFGLGHTTNKSD